MLISGVVSTSAAAPGKSSERPAIGDAEQTRQIQLIANESDGILRYQETEELVEALAPLQFPQTLDLMLMPGAGDNDGLIGLASKVLARWTELSPDAAADWIRRVPDGTTFGRNAYGVVGEAKARTDSVSALNWLKALPQGENRLAAQAAVAAVIARKDPPLALSLVEDLPHGSRREPLILFCVLNWSNTDFDGAAAWVQKQEDADRRAQLSAKLAMQEAVKDPGRAANFALAAVPSGQERRRAVSQIVRFWTAATPQSSAAWVANLPEGELKDATVEALAETWARKDARQAAGWLRALSPGRVRDIALRTFTRITTFEPNHFSP